MKKFKTAQVGSPQKKFEKSKWFCPGGEGGFQLDNGNISVASSYVAR